MGAVAGVTAFCSGEAAVRKRPHDPIICSYNPEQIFEFDSRHAHEGLLGANGISQSEFFITGQDFVTELVKSQIFGFTVINGALEKRRLQGELGPCRFLRVASWETWL